jgi:hypothetical protein
MEEGSVMVQIDGSLWSIFSKLLGRIIIQLVLREKIQTVHTSDLLRLDIERSEPQGGTIQDSVS